MQDQQQLKQAAEFVAKKAPWLPVATQAPATDKGALTLAVIQRLEREKKLEQIKEQQQMMQIIAQQQAATLAREQVTDSSVLIIKEKHACKKTKELLQIGIRNFLYQEVKFLLRNRIDICFVFGIIAYLLIR